MISSRKIQDLDKAIASKAMQHVAECKAAGIDLLIYCTFRDGEAQDALYAQGRTAPGSIVTNAKAGESVHNYRLAYDAVPVVNGKAVWDKRNPIWQTVGKLGEKCGLEWAGRWKRFKEFPHFQYTGGLTIQQLQNGLRP